MASIDRDHALLVSLINTLHAAETAREESCVVGSVLYAVRDYTSYHLDREERLMAACRYADMDRHWGLHRAFRQRIRDHVADYEADRPAFDAQPLVILLRTWLVAHIVSEDARLRETFLAHPGILADLGEEPIIDLAAVEREAATWNGPWPNWTGKN